MPWCATAYRLSFCFWFGSHALDRQEPMDVDGAHLEVRVALEGGLEGVVILGFED